MFAVNLYEKSTRTRMGKQKFYRKGFPFYEVYQDGVYMGMWNGCMVARRKIIGYQDRQKLLVAPEGDEGFELHIPKIPFKYWKMVWSFYLDVTQKYGTEAAVLFYWNRGEKGLEDLPADLVEEYGDGLLIDHKLVLYVPKQENTAVSTKYYGDRMRDWLNQNMEVLLDTHSHNTMRAFFSGIDDANEQRFQFYAVYGRLGTANTFVMRYRFQDVWRAVGLDELFEEGEIPEGVKGEIGYPIGWLNQCTF